MKKTVGPDRVPVEMWKVLRDVIIGWLKDNYNQVFIEEKYQKIGEKLLLYQYLKAKKTYKNVGTIKE